MGSAKLVSVLLLLGAVICAAQVQLPDTPAGHQLSGWIESFNRGDQDAYREFLQKNYPSALEHFAQYAPFR